MKQKKLEIVFDDTYYRSDAIEHGRIVKTFVKDLTDRIFQKSYRSYLAQKELGIEDTWLPLLYQERNLYSTFSAAIDEITPIHLSEWSLNKSDNDSDKARRVDFWCLHKNRENGKAINFFIELKKNYYCVSEGTSEQVSTNAKNTITGVIQQIAEIKKLKLKWDGDGDAYLGVIVTHGYRSGEKAASYQATTVRDEIYRLLDDQRGAQLLFSTWNLPDDMPIQWESDKCDFVTISTVVITTQRNN